MEIRAFAEQILFGTSLQDKLLEVGRVTDLSDVDRGGGIKTPGEPGRPAMMGIDDTRSRVSFPSLSELEDPTRRGHVMHFFANHELLALELMALALLKFPEAPDSFRRGLVGTMLEEQEHLRLYLAQMKRDGVEPGQIPVNRYFWDCIASMQTPIDLVVRMSMTFEQANLDYAAFYARAFETIGDQQTAEVLKLVFHDEIKHVRHGVGWFERWRQPGEDLFDAYCRLLPSPLTARRARGKIFDAQARRRAGLPQSYIDKLEVFGASRGRPPVVHWFEPHCEAQIAHGAAHTPKADLRALAQDLETLPLWLASPDDVILTRRAPSPDFLRALSNAGVELPQFVAHDPQKPARLDEHPHLSALAPWGWSPLVEKHLSPLVSQLPQKPPIWGQWSEARRSLYAKTWSVVALRQLCQSHDWPSWWSQPDEVGVVVHTQEDALERAKALGQLGFTRVAFKAPWGASGRQMIRVDDAMLAPGQEGWLRRTLERQGALVVEPWLDKVADFSAQFHVLGNRDVSFKGITRFLTDVRGQYQGTILGRNVVLGLGTEVHRWLTDDGRSKQRLQKALKQAARAVGLELAKAGYAGPVGIDAMLYRAQTPQGPCLRLKPIVEVNPRHTMGQVALALRGRCAPRTAGFWGIWPVRALGPDGVKGLMDAIQHHAPLQRTKAAWTQGAMLTSDPHNASRVVSAVLLAPNLPACAQLAQRLGLPSLTFAL